MVVVAAEADVEVVELDEYPWGQLRAGDGEGDFLERLSGASAPVAEDPPAMSTCSSTRRGDGVGAATTGWGEPMGPVVVLAWATDGGTGGEIDVECGDWK